MEMDKLLDDWNLSHLKVEFRKHRIEPEMLKYLTDEEVKELCPIIGDRVRLRLKLREEIKQHYSKRPENLLIALKDSHEGEEALNYYNEHKQLKSIHRSYIAHAVVDHYLKKYGKMSTKDFESMAEQIESYFIGETKENYYMPGFVNISGKRVHSRGNLIARYYNTKKHEKRPEKVRKIVKQKDQVNITDFTTPELDESSRQEGEQLRLTLAEAKVKSKEVETKWKMTYLLRRREFLEEYADTIEVIKKWPLISLSFGCELVHIDFEILYPGKSNLIFDKWSNFKRKIIEKYKMEIKHGGIVDILLMENTEISTEYQNFTIVSLLSRVLRPTTKVKVKQSYTKPSILESRDAFIFHVNKYSDVRQSVEQRQKERVTKGRKFQPFIVAYGEEQTIDGYCVIFDTIEYRFQSVLEAINSCFQLHQILHLSYNEECIQIWMFIQQYFYEIYTPWDVPLKSVTSLISELNKIP